jgi:acyl-CoA reductase-like NAD-dependent aldehyde dehydrogenase
VTSETSSKAGFAEGESTFNDLNPADPDDVVARFPLSSNADVTAATAAAQRALPARREVPPIARGRYLLAMGRALRAREGEIVAAITREQGKPLASRGVSLARRSSTSTTTEGSPTS